MTSRLLATALLAALAAAPVSAPRIAHAADSAWNCEELDPDTMDAVGWRAKLEGPDSVEAGTPATFTVEVSILPDHVLYQERADVALGENAKGITLGTVSMPPTKRKFDKLLGKEVDYWDRETLTLSIPVTFEGKAGKRTLELVVTHQACNPCLCLFPTPTTLTKSVTVTQKTAAAPSPSPSPSPSPLSRSPSLSPSPSPSPTALASASAASADPGDPDAGSSSALTNQDAMAELIASNFLLALGVAFLGGLLISLTPCVYPMIPITIAVIGNQASRGGQASAAEGRWRGFGLSLVYVLGITAVYATLGVIAAKSGREFGFLLQSPWVRLGVAAVFVALAASMFGAFNIQLPAALQTRLSTYQGGGTAGVFVTGLFAGIVAGPCTAPVLIGILVAIGSGAVGVRGGFALMTAFSLGMGVLFVALGTFSGLLSALPRSGAWMERVKHVFGVLLAAGALYFIELAVPEWIFAICLGASLVLLGVGLGAATRLDPGAGNGERFAKGVGWLAAAAGIWFFLGGLATSGYGPQWLPSGGLATAGGARGAAATAHRPEPPWVLDEAEGRRLASESGKVMVVDFYADWCLACKELDEYTYTDPRVIELAARDFVPVKIDTTIRFDTPPERRRMLADLKKRYEIRGLPKVVFVKPDGAIMDELTVSGFLPADRFLDRMERARDCAKPAATC